MVDRTVAKGDAFVRDPEADAGGKPSAQGSLSRASGLGKRRAGNGLRKGSLQLDSA